MGATHIVLCLTNYLSLVQTNSPQRNDMQSKTGDPGTVQEATLREWLVSITTYLSIPLTLSACGGDIGWWQAWVFFLDVSS